MPRNYSVINHQATEAKEATGKAYRKPRLEKLGDLRTLTLGGSPGVNDTVNTGVTQPAPNPFMPNPNGPYNQPGGGQPPLP